MKALASLTASVAIGTSLIAAAPAKAGIKLPSECLAYELILERETIADKEELAISIGRTAVELLKLSSFPEAVLVAKCATSLNPNDERLWRVLAEAQLNSNQLEDARQSLATLKIMNPDNAELWFAEASIAVVEKRPNKAIVLIQRGLQLDSNNASAYFDLGNARIMQNKLVLALQSFEKATEINPVFWQALNNQAVVLFEMGERSEAVIRWIEAVKIDDSHPEPLFALAAATYDKCSNNTKPFTLAQAALDLDSSWSDETVQKEHLWGSKLMHNAKEMISEIKHPSQCSEPGKPTLRETLSDTPFQW